LNDEPKRRPERARRFTSRLDAERERSKLDPNALIKLEEFADLIGDYRFPKADFVRCQLVDQKGKCKREHGKGWIAQLKDETEGYIGHVCAEDHFGADPRFAALFEAARARVDREITTDQLVKRLGDLLANREQAAAIQNATFDRWQALSDRIFELRNLLPIIVRDKLADRAKRRNAEVLIKDLYTEIEKDEVTGKEKIRIRPSIVRWGVLSGLEALKTGPVQRIGGKLNEASAALQNAVASIDTPTLKMSKWAKALDYCTPVGDENQSRADKDIAKIEDLVDTFCAPANLKLLWLLTPKRLDQLATVRAVLEITDGRQPEDREVTITCDRWRQEIVQTHNGREFEIVG
jgi:hypothetical protein